jgi:CysZ protein
MQHSDSSPAAGAARSQGMGGLFRGLFAALRGTGAALGNRDVYKVYFQFTLILLVLSLILAGALGYGVWHLTEPETAGGFLARHGLDSLAVGGLVVLRIAGIVIAALVAPLLAFLLIGILFPVFAEALFFAGLRRLDPARAQALEGQPGLSILASLWKTLRLLVHLVVITAIAFVVSLVPLVGVVLGPALQLWNTGKILGWELLDPYFDKRRMAFAAQKVYVREHRAAVVGFGLPWAFVLAIPLLGPLLFGLAQAAAPGLLVNVLEPGARPAAPPMLAPPPGSWDPLGPSGPSGLQG